MGPTGLGSKQYNYIDLFMPLKLNNVLKVKFSALLYYRFLDSVTIAAVLMLSIMELLFSCCFYTFEINIFINKLI